MLDEMDAWVEGKLKEMDEAQLTTLKALLFAGYRGERDYVLLELLKAMGEEKITPSELTEEFTYVEQGREVRYLRILPEFYRAVRKRLMEGS